MKSTFLAFVLLVLTPDFSAAQPPYSAEPAAFAPEMAASQHRVYSGLLGRTYLRGAYLHRGGDEPNVSQFDDSEQGFDVEFNTPIQWLSRGAFGADIYGEFQQIGISGSNVTGLVDIDGNRSNVGTRLFVVPHPKFRPYLGLSVAHSRISAYAEDSGSGASVLIKDNDTAFFTNLGVEADLLPKLSARADVEIVPEESKSNKFEGTLVWWVSKRAFIRGGLLVPLRDGSATGGTIGAGLSF